jgi:hypothetical protein
MNPVIAGSLITAGASLLGSRSSARQSQRNAREQMRFQANQSATGYQRAIADMKKAGLNPMLAAKLGPAPAMSGAMGSVPDYGSSITSGLNAGANVAQSSASYAKTKAETNRVELETRIKELKDLPEATVKGMPYKVASFFVNTIMDAIGDDVTVIQGKAADELRSTFRYLKNQSVVFASEVVNKLAEEQAKARKGGNNNLVSSIKALISLFGGE